LRSGKGTKAEQAPPDKPQTHAARTVVVELLNRDIDPHRVVPVAVVWVVVEIETLEPVVSR
jgi:hypothetical protein